MFEIRQGDCISKMKEMADASVDSVVTDPPYGIDLMSTAGETWDSFGREREYQERGGYNNKGILPGYGRGGTSRQREAYRRKANLSYQEWCEAWAKEALRVLKPGGHLLSFSGSRTYHRLACALEDVGFEVRDQIMWVYGSGMPKSLNLKGEFEGWGTSLKPSHEPICVARKPLEGTVAKNMEAYTVGAFNIKDCKVQVEGEKDRWPSNLIHDGSEEVNQLFPVDGARSSARFFYCPKASKDDKGVGNEHPTVKPTELMRYLVKLVTPTGGLVLDPFSGSGSTGKAAILEGMRYIGVELSEDYAQMSRDRLHKCVQDVYGKA